MKPLFFAVSLGLVLTVACSPGPQTDSKSNWLLACETSAECGTELACACGICTSPCASAEQCDGGADAECRSSSELASCASGEEVAICLPTCAESADCDAGQMCLSGVCLADETVERDVCASQHDWDPEVRDFELLVLEKINSMRAAGGSCDGSSYAPQVSLALSFELRCAARNHSQAMLEQAFLGSTGPDGVDFMMRVLDTGYLPTLTSAVYAIGEGEQRVDDLLSEYCLDVFDSRLTDVAAGQVADRLTILFSVPR